MDMYLTSLRLNLPFCISDAEKKGIPTEMNSELLGYLEE
jgi:hypothetical protein